MSPRRGVLAKLAGALCLCAAAVGGTWALQVAWHHDLFLVPVAIVPFVMAAMAGLVGLVLLGLWLLGPPLWRSPSVPVAERRPQVRRRVIVIPESRARELAGSARATRNGTTPHT